MSAVALGSCIVTRTVMHKGANLWGYQLHSAGYDIVRQLYKRVGWWGYHGQAPATLQQVITATTTKERSGLSCSPWEILVEVRIISTDQLFLFFVGFFFFSQS